MEAQVLSPFFYMTHECGFRLWTVGDKASQALEVLAEDGNPTPLVDEFKYRHFVCEVGRTTDATPPGGSVNIEVSAAQSSSKCGCITTASMLVGTNDAFAGYLDVPLTKFEAGNEPVTSFAFDAGTEANTELCKDIPGPPCVGDGLNLNSDKDQEGFVHVNRGISGMYEVPIRYDWRAVVIFGQAA